MESYPSGTGDHIGDQSDSTAHALIYAQTQAQKQAASLPAAEAEALPLDLAHTEG